MALDKDTGNTLFGNIKKKDSEKQEDFVNSKTIFEETETIKNHLSKAKWEQFDKVTTLLTSEQKEGLDRIAKKLMKYRSKELKGKDNKERITANMLIRALIENFLHVEETIQLEVLSSEEEVYKWIFKVLERFYQIKI